MTVVRVLLVDDQAPFLRAMSGHTGPILLPIGIFAILFGVYCR